MPFSKKNHYVPQFYLKQWSADGEHIWQYKKLVPNMNVPLWAYKSTSEIAYEKYLYAQNTGKTLCDDFEKWISQEVENPAKNVISKLISGSTLISSEKIDIARFVLVQQLRTPAFFLKNQPRWQSLAQEVIIETGEKLQKLFSENRLTKDSLKGKTQFPKYYQPQVKATWCAKQGGSSGYNIEANIGRATWLSTIRRVSETVVPKMAKYNWRVINASDDIEWPTSDDPVICLNFRSMNDYSFEAGVYTNLANIILPVTPKHIIFAEVGSNHPIDAIDKSPIYSAFFRRIILEHAFINVYCSKRSPFMQEECRPLVSEKKYNHMKQVFSEWNDIQSAIESEFIE